MTIRRRFRNSRLDDCENINPMEGMLNLADVMLVLAAGLMLALIINWNIDIGEVVSVTQGREVSGDMQDLNGDTGDESLDYTQYEKMGIVYKDPSTGKLYMVTSNE